MTDQHTCSYPGGDQCVECLLEAEHESGPFEHKHRWQVDVRNSIVVETCRCGERRSRSKGRYEYEAYKAGGKGHSRKSRQQRSREHG